MTKVSVIVTTYNRKEHLTETIQSILNQTYQDFELIVVDNYSNYDFYSHINSFNDSRIKPYQNRNNGIIAINRNFGVAKANGDFLAFCDDDDIWHNQKLEKQLPHFQDNNIVGVGSNVIFKSLVFYKNTYFGKSKIGYKDYCYYDSLLNNPVASSSAVIKKADFLIVGGFDQNSKFRFIEDWELWIRLMQRGNFRIVTLPLITYRINFNDRDKSDITKRKLDVFKKHIDLGYITQSNIKEPKANIYFDLAIQMFLSNVYASKKYFSMAFETSAVINTKIKAMIGLLLSVRSAVMRRTIFNFLNKVNRLIRLL